MTIDRKLSVFIGSTMEDFSGVRDELIKALLEAGHIPCGMELWTAGHVPTWQRIQEELDQCDIHLILVGSKYGTPATGKKGSISFTQREYQLSKQQRRPIIAFLLNKSQFDKEMKLLDPKDRHKLTIFRRELEDKAVCRYFSQEKKNSLPLDCVNSINQTINNNELPKNYGWVRANTELGERISAVRSEFLQRILDRLYQFTTLTNRLEADSQSKQIIGNVFWKLMLGRIRRKKYHDIFFESGSTLAYVSGEFERVLRASQSDHTEWHVSTNNVLTLLELLLHTRLEVLLHTRLEVRPRPAGAPEDRYGAMFDDVLLRHPETQPTCPRTLFDTEREAIEKTRDVLQGDKRKRLYLMTASGIDLKHKEEYFRDPHVGSHANALFKRAIFNTEQPMVMFLTGNKLEAPFDFNIGKCYPVFDKEFTWKNACEECRLAICIGYSNGITENKKESEKKRDIYRKLLEESKELKNFDFDYAEEVGKNGGAFMIANNAFKEIFPVE